jgi:2-oxoglutarate ferredoxin oxidoreductase subunit beta
LKDIIKQGIQHKGLAFIDILQPCPTYNDINTKEWYAGEGRLDPKTGKPISRLYKLEEIGYDPVVHDLEQEFKKTVSALEKSREWGDKIPLGVFYKNELVSTYEERITQRIPYYMEKPPAKQKISDERGIPTAEMKKLFDELKV